MKPVAQPGLTDRRLIAAYHEANQLGAAGMEAICPLFFELSEISTRYRDEVPIGQGGAKTVTKVYDSRSKKWLAMARPRVGLGPEFLDRFVHEAWLTASLAHPNIIKIYDVGVDPDGSPFFTLDLKSDHTLADFITPGRATADGQVLNERELLEVFVKVCDAIAYAHSRGVLHLDIKPDNIQVEHFGEVLVCDWGLGRSLDDIHEGTLDLLGVTETRRGTGTQGLTLHGEIKGTPGFMAPEQTEANAPTDERSDGFALGCLLYAILTRAPVFTGKTPDEVLEQTRRAEIIPPHERFPQRPIPLSLEAVVMKAVARDPAQRYATVSELRHEVARYLAGYATHAEHPGFLREFVLFVRRNRQASFISLLALIALSVASVLFVQGIHRNRDLTRREHERAEQLTIESLDLRACSLVLTQPVALPNLLEVHITTGQIDPAQLRANILSIIPVKIIESAPRD